MRIDLFSAAARRSETDAARALFLAALILSGAACAGAPVVPEPRRLVVHSGERLAPEPERMQLIHEQVVEQYDSIVADPSFLIRTIPAEGPVFPWDALKINEQGDTASIEFQGNSDARPAYLFYAHLHLMAAQDRLDRWLPEADGVDGFEVEKAVLERTADVWLHRRTLFDARPYALMDELIYARENGFLDAYILTSRPGAFVAARREWLAEQPDAVDAYVEWFRRTFQRQPPGMRGASGAS